MNKSVSVIIVTFNAAKTLNTAIQSVLNQSYKNIECLVIDGASTDGTVEIVKKYGIRYVSEPDNGIYDAMNKGWKMAQGEWILYLGADDELLPTGIESLVKNCNNCDVVYGNTVLKFPSGKTKEQYSKESNKILTDMISCHQSLMMKKNMFNLFSGFDTKYKLAADYDLVLKAYLASFRFKQINNFISVFMLSRTSYRDVKKIIIEKYNVQKGHKINLILVINAGYYFFKLYINLIKRRLTLINKTGS